jgi:hypothetical protein
MKKHILAIRLAALEAMGEERDKRYMADAGL